MHTLEYFYEKGIIPETFRDVIPTYCRCGYPTILNDNLTQLSCSNPICPEHMAYKMDTMFKQLNMKDLGPSRCRAMIIENDLAHHAQVFLLDEMQMPSENQDSVKMKFYNEIHKVDALPLAGIAKLLRAPDMQTRCEDIFKGYNDIDEFYKDFNYSEDFIAKQTKLSKGILTERFTRSLTYQEPILRGLCKCFKIIKVAKEDITICMTGDVVTATRTDGSHYKSREVFIKEMQDVLQGKLNIIKKTSVSEKIDFLITDTPHSGTAKNKRADQLGKPRLTFKEFQDLLIQYSNL